jgi:hypothetical protein
VDDLQELQLRGWAEALREAGGTERMAMANAIFMLLEQVDLLRAELRLRPIAPEEPTCHAQEFVDEDTRGSETEAATTPLDDGGTVGLRNRLRAVARRPGR